MLEATFDGLARLSGPLEFEADLHYPGAPQSRDERGGDTVRRLKQALTHGPAFSEWIARPELVARLQQLLGPQVTMPLAPKIIILSIRNRSTPVSGERALSSKHPNTG